MNKLQKRVAVGALAFLSLLCMGAGAFAYGKKPLSAAAESKTLALGTDLIYTAETDLVSVVKATSQTGTIKGAVDSVFTHATTPVIQSNITRGQTAVLQFAEPVHIRDYATLALTLGKNITAFATLDFYQNGEDTVIGETQSAFHYYFYAYSDADGAAGAVAERKTVPLPLANFADEDGYVDSILVTHTSDERSAGDYANFFLTVYGAELQSLANEHAFLPNVHFTAVAETQATVAPSVTAEYPSAGFVAQSGYTEEKIFVNEFSRGKATVLKFAAPIDTAKYAAVSFAVTKSISANATLDFYRDEESTVVGETASVYTASIVANSGEQTTVYLPLDGFADENGNVNNLILVHTDDEKEEDFANFSLCIFEMTADYRLLINGEDMTCGQKNGEFVELVMHAETEKMYANGFMRGKAVEIAFGAPINVNFYKTLKLPISLKNVGATYTYYLMGFAYGSQNLQGCAPSGRYAVQNNDTVVLEIALEDYADASGAVAGLSLWHYGDTYATDFNGLSLYVFGAEVCVASPTAETEKSFPCKIETVGYEKGAETDVITLDFDCPVFTAVNQTAIDAQVAQYVKINGERLVESDVKSVVYGYGGAVNRMALEVKSKIVNDGNDCLEIVGLQFTQRVGDTSYTYAAANDCEVYFPKSLQAGERIALADGVEVLSARSTQTEIVVEWSIPLGETVGYGVEEFLILNGQTLSVWGVTATADGNTLRFPCPTGAWKGDGTDEISVQKGLATENAYLTKSVSFVAKDGVGVWYKQSDTPLYVLWIQDLAPEKETTTFSVKFLQEYARGGNIENFASSFFDKFEINGATLTDVLQTDARARVDLRGQYLDVTISATGYAHCIGFDENDGIVIKKGFALPQGGETAFDMKFVYDALWEQFSVVPDTSQIPDEWKLTTVSVEMVESDRESLENGTTMIFVKFAYPCSYRFYPFMQMHVSMMPSRLESISATNPSDLFLSEMALYGVFDSVLDKLYFDGLSMREWMLKDKRMNVDWKDIVDIRFLGTGFNDGYSMQFTFSKNSSASQFTKGEHTIEFKAGFITPNLNVLQKDLKYQWNETLRKWEGVSTAAEEEFTADGCGAVTPAALIPALLGAAVALCMKKRKGEENDG